LFDRLQAVKEIFWARLLNYYLALLASHTCAFEYKAAGFRFLFLFYGHTFFEPEAAAERQINKCAMQVKFHY